MQDEVNSLEADAESAANLIEETLRRGALGEGTMPAEQRKSMRPSGSKGLRPRATHPGRLGKHSGSKTPNAKKKAKARAKRKATKR